MQVLKCLKRTPGQRWKMVATKMWGHPRIQSKDPEKPSSTARTISLDIKLTKEFHIKLVFVVHLSQLYRSEKPLAGLVYLGTSSFLPLLVGGLEHGFYFPFHIWDNPSHWRTHMFQDGYCTTNQPQSLPSCQCRRPVTGSVSVSSAAVELMMSRPDLDQFPARDGFWWWEKFLGCFRPNLIRTYLRKGISGIYIYNDIYIYIQWYIYIMVMLFGWLY